MFILLASCRTVASSDLWLLHPVGVDSFAGLFSAADLFSEGTKICAGRDRSGEMFSGSACCCLLRRCRGRLCQQRAGWPGLRCGNAAPPVLARGLPHLSHTAMGGHLLSLVEQLGLRGEVWLRSEELEMSRVTVGNGFWIYSCCMSRWLYSLEGDFFLIVR